MTEKAGASNLKNLRMMLDLGIISTKTKPQVAEAVYFRVINDPVISQRERDDPEPKKYSDRPCLRGRYFLREHIVRKIVAEMSAEERAELRARITTLRVTQIPSGRANEPLKI